VNLAEFEELVALERMEGWRVEQNLRRRRHRKFAKKARKFSTRLRLKGARSRGV
jgi:hypothetical protein